MCVCGEVSSPKHGHLSFLRRPLCVQRATHIPCILLCPLFNVTASLGVSLSDRSTYPSLFLVPLVSQLWSGTCLSFPSRISVPQSVPDISAGVEQPNLEWRGQLGAGSHGLIIYLANK